MPALSSLSPNNTTASSSSNHTSSDISTQAIVAMAILGTVLLIGSLIWSFSEIHYIITTTTPLPLPFPAVITGSFGTRFAAATSLARWSDEYTGFLIIPVFECAGTWIWKAFRRRGRHPDGDEESIRPAHGGLHSIVLLAWNPSITWAWQAFIHDRPHLARPSDRDEESMQPAQTGQHSIPLQDWNPSVPRAALFPTLPHGLSSGDP